MSLQNPPVLAIQHELALIDAGLRLVLGTMSEFHVLPAESSARRLETADVMVLDHEAALRRLRTALPGAPNALVVSPIGHDTNVRGALESGVLGFVSTTCSADEIRMAVRVVAAGRRYLCGPASLRIADSLALPALTARENDVLALVSRGRNNKEVARLLDVSVGTVKSHMRALLSKLGAQCRTEAMWIASQRGLIPRSDHPCPAHREAMAPQPAETRPVQPPLRDLAVLPLRVAMPRSPRVRTAAARLDIVASATC